jgi:hypothetical protein
MPGYLRTSSGFRSNQQGTAINTSSSAIKNNAFYAQQAKFKSVASGWADFSQEPNPFWETQS